MTPSSLLRQTAALPQPSAQARPYTQPNSGSCSNKAKAAHPGTAIRTNYILLLPYLSRCVYARRTSASQPPPIRHGSRWFPLCRKLTTTIGGRALSLRLADQLPSSERLASAPAHARLRRTSIDAIITSRPGELHRRIIDMAIH